MERAYRDKPAYWRLWDLRAQMFAALREKDEEILARWRAGLSPARGTSRAVEVAGGTNGKLLD